MKIASLITSVALGLAFLGQPVLAQNLNEMGKIFVECDILSVDRGRSCRPHPPPHLKQKHVRPDTSIRRSQIALSYFGFPAGTPDGFMGIQTRLAIRDFQGFMGFPVTGQLNDHERIVLMEAYDRAQSGGAREFLKVLQTEGPRGILRALNPTENVRAPVPYSPHLPPVLPKVPPTPAERSITDYCTTVDRRVLATGHLAGPAFADPAQALDEQFCAARSYSIRRAQKLFRNDRDATSSEDRQKCEKLAEIMAPILDTLETTDPTQTIATVETFAGRFAAPQSQLRGIGEACLGIGYQADDAHVVMAAAMLLLGAGETAYAEVFAHHLRLGLGVPEDPARAMAWYSTALDALDNGATPAFWPSQSAERIRIIRAALSTQ